MFRRTLVIAVLLALLAPAAAFAQSGGGAFGPLPPSAPAETPTPEPDDGNSLTSDLGGRQTLLIIGGLLLVGFVGIGVFISRDARRALPERHRPADGHRLRDEGPHKHKQQAKARARARGKAQKEARRRNR
jgi:hypothetical protein